MDIRCIICAIPLLMLAGCGGSHSGGGANSRYLDTTFGSGGNAYVDIGGGDDVATDLVVLTDGSIVVAGYARQGVAEHFALARFTASGQPDSAFGTGGTMVHDTGLGNARAWGVAVQNDGKILAAGTLQNGLDTDVQLVRYLQDGTPDVAFGTGGVVTMDIGGDLNTAMDIALQNDGKILLTGNSADFLLVMRFNTDGTPDAGFATNGVASIDVPHSNGVADAVGEKILLDANGLIIVAGEGFELGAVNSPTRIDFFVVRLQTGGAVDTTFGDNGYIIVRGNENDHLTGLQMQPDGRIVAASVSYLVGFGDRPVVYRYNTDGSADTTFGDNGSYRGDFQPSIQESGALALADDGSLLNAIYLKSATDPTFEDILLERLTTAGTLDSGYGVAGSVRVYTQTLKRSSNLPLDTAPPPIQVATAPGSRLVVMTSRWNNSDFDFGLTRILLAR